MTFRDNSMFLYRGVLCSLLYTILFLLQLFLTFFYELYFHFPIIFSYSISFLCKNKDFFTDVCLTVVDKELNFARKLKATAAFVTFSVGL